MPFHVDSEVGKLRKVLVHAPGLEHRRLTPTNAEDLLFDDVMWVKRAIAEHEEFCTVLRDHGIEVFDTEDLLAETLDIAEARRWVLGRVLDERMSAPTWHADGPSGQKPPPRGRSQITSSAVWSSPT